MPGSNGSSRTSTSTPAAVAALAGVGATALLYNKTSAVSLVSLWPLFHPGESRLAHSYCSSEPPEF